MKSLTFNFRLFLNFRDVTVTLSQNVLIFVSNTSQLIGLVHFNINDWNHLVFWKKSSVALLKCFSVLLDILMHVIAHIH